TPNSGENTPNSGENAPNPGENPLITGYSTPMKGGSYMTDAVIVDALRTATGKKKGALAQTHPVDILTPVLKELVNRNGIDPAKVEDVVTGCVTMTDEQGGNIGRMAVLAAGFP